MILQAFRPDVRNSAKAEARDALLDALADCPTPDSKADLLKAHLAVTVGLLAHEVGDIRTRAALLNIVRSMEGQSA